MSTEMLDCLPEMDDESGVIRKTERNANIGTAIQDGIDLRKQKKVTTFNKKVKIISVDAKGPCDRSPPKFQYPRSPKKGRSLVAEAGAEDRSRSRSPKEREKASSRDKCPLRIAELAEPRKIHCIRTWRDNSDSLPSHMLDRLQQRIMDQRAIVQVDEAVHFFQIGQRRVKTPRKKKVRTTNIEPTDEEIKYLTALFVRNMAQRLSKPMNVNATSKKIINLSQEVFTEISKLLYMRQICPIECTVDNETIQSEISTKIAIWIAEILSESDEKMIEEELRAKTTKERKNGKEGHIRTVIENYLRTHYPEKELEEEEGPVLDFIDRLVESVMKICHADSTQPTSVNESGLALGEHGSSDQRLKSGSQTDEDIHDVITDVVRKTFDQAFNVAEHVTDDDGDQFLTTQQESDNTDEILATSQQETDDTDEMLATSQQEDDTDEILATRQRESDDDIDKLDTEYRVSMANNALNLVTEDSNNDSNALDNDGEQTENAVDEDGSTPIDDSGVDTTAHVSAAMDVDENDSNNSELQRDEKKVTFSSVDSGLGIAIKERVTSLEKKNSFTISTDPIKSDIIFAPPNLQLLSDADESWPDGLQHTIGIKFSDSVSKSITSLGHLDENDEKINDETGREVYSKESALDSSRKKGSATLDSTKESILDSFREKGSVNTNEIHSNGEITSDYDTKNIITNQHHHHTVANNKKLLEDTKQRRFIKSIIDEANKIKEKEDKIFAGLFFGSNELEIDKDVLKGIEKCAEVANSQDGKTPLKPAAIPLTKANADESLEGKYRLPEFKIDIKKKASKEKFKLEDEAFKGASNQKSASTQHHSISIISVKSTNDKPANHYMTVACNRTTNQDSMVKARDSIANHCMLIPCDRIRNRHNVVECDRTTNTNMTIPSDGIANQNVVVHGSSVSRNKVSVYDKIKCTCKVACDRTASKNVAARNGKVFSGLYSPSAREQNISNIVVNKKSFQIQEHKTTCCKYEENIKYNLTSKKRMISKNAVNTVSNMNKKINNRDMTSNEETISSNSYIDENRDARVWRKELQRTVDNLNHWHDWIDEQCAKMAILKQKTESDKRAYSAPTSEVTREVYQEWVSLKSDIDKDASLWNKLKLKTEKALETYRPRAKSKFELPKISNPKPLSFEDLCLDIDSLSIWMHRLIVSTEYCLKCKCKYVTKTR